MIKLNKPGVTFVVLSTLLLAGCDSPKDANKSNFEKAVNASLEKECIIVSPMGMFDAKPYPVRLAVIQPDNFTSQEQADKRNSERFSNLDALVKAGVLAVRETQVNEIVGFSETGKQVSGREYSLTGDGKKYLKSDKRPDFCVGHYKVDEINDFTEPGDAMGMKISRVNYTYSPAGVAAWVNNDEIKKAFPELSRQMETKQKGHKTLVLKNDGWSAER